MGKNNYHTEEFELQSTKRYIRQNMNKAIRGDVIRALVELITNSDDSYKRLEEKSIKVDGGIVIEIDRKVTNSILYVRDRAEGMTFEEMKYKIAKIGELTSGFEKGKTIRGLHGRGAKDIADLGDIRFESIKNDEYTKLTISQDVKVHIETIKKVSQEIRNKLKIKKNGTIVSIYTTEGVSISLHESLLKKLSTYYSLRDINSNPRRKLHLIDLNKKRNDPIVYKYPEGEVVYNQQLRINEYPDATINIIIKKHSTPFEREPSNSPYRDGILIKSSGAIHDCQYFGLESDSLAWRFSGEIVCGYIDTLIYDYEIREQKKDYKKDKNNPMRILDPDRNGLITDHLFTKLLIFECKKILSSLIEQLKTNESPSSRQVTNSNLDNKLTNLSKEISEVFEKDLKELEQDETLLDYGDQTKHLPRGLQIIPAGTIEIVKSKKKTIMVYFVSENIDFNTPIKINCDNNQIKINKNQVNLQKRDLYSGRASFTVESSFENKTATVSVTYKEFQRSINIKVIEIEDLFKYKDGLFFLKDKFYITHGKEKTVEAYLKTNQYLLSKEVRLISSHSDIVVLGGGINKLNSTIQRNLYKTKFRLEGRRKKATSVITATIENFPSASANVTVEERDKTGLDFDFEPKEIDPYPLRYEWDKLNLAKLIIGAKHPSIRKYLGEPIKDIYPGINSPLYHMILAEVIAEALTFKLLNTIFTKEGENRKLDYDTTDYYFHKYFSKYLQIAHKYLDQQRI